MLPLVIFVIVIDAMSKLMNELLYTYDMILISKSMENLIKTWPEAF